MTAKLWSFLVYTATVFSALALSGCGGELTHVGYEAILNSPKHQALVKNPRCLVGTYYEVPEGIDFIGSVSADSAIETQNINQMSKIEMLTTYRQKENFDRVHANSVLLNEGSNEEDAKVSLLLKVVDGWSTDKRATSLLVLVLNKKYAGSKYWVGSEDFFTDAKQIACPVANGSNVEFNGTPRTSKHMSHQNKLARNNHR